MPQVRFACSARLRAVENDMPENLADQLGLLETLTPQEREELARTLARVLDTMVSS